MCSCFGKMSIYSFLLLIGLLSVWVTAAHDGGDNENQVTLAKWYSSWNGDDRKVCGNRLNYAIYKKCQARGSRYKIRLDLNGGVAPWGAYKRCTNCGANINYKRTRTCTQPKPQGYGKTCKEHLHETLKCGMQGFCKEIPADHRLTAENHHKNQKSLASCMAWCRSKGDCGMVAYGVKGENKENWCLRFSKAQRDKGCTPTYAAAVQKKAELDIEYNIHFNDHACDQMTFEHNTCGHIKDGVGHCSTWDEMHLNHFYPDETEASCRKKCENTEGCGVFTLGKADGNRPGYCDLWEKGAARICKVIEQKVNWRMYSKNKCEDEAAVQKWGPVRRDGKCGAKLNADCTSGRCCSIWGWCGTSDAYCKNGGTRFESDAPTNIELFDEPNKFEMIERGMFENDAKTTKKSIEREKDDKSGKDDTEDRSLVKGMRVRKDVLTARNAASQFLHSRVKRDWIGEECCGETCDHHEIWEVCEDRRENREERREES